MLNYKINNRGLEYREELLSKDDGLGGKNLSILTPDFNESYITIRTNGYHNLKDNDIVLFTFNSENGQRILKEGKVCNVINPKEFEVPPFIDYTISPSNIFDISDFNKPRNVEVPENERKSAILLSSEITCHTFVDKYEYDIKHCLYGTNGKVNKIDNENESHCDGDIILYNDIFLLKMKNVKKNVYDFSSYDVVNLTHDIYFYRGYEKVVLKDCIIPGYEYGPYDGRRLYWEYDPKNAEDVEIVEYIKDHFGTLLFYVVDDSFLTIKNGEIKLRDTADIYKIVGDMNINVPISAIPDINLKQHAIYNDFLLDEIAENHINETIDMEKQIFTPVLKKNEVKNEVIKIKFNVKLRQRGDDVNDIDTTIQAWRDNDIKNAWPNDEIINKNDLLGYWGFTDDDVLYQKNALKKSFLRLSFYDTNKRSTQSLLYYTTIFLDGGRLYGRYVENINKGYKNYVNKGISVDASMVHNLEFNSIFSIMDGSMFVTDNSDYTQSSEGFYLYLFPSLCKGNTPTTIYMKAEFNHAKFGFTLPLIIKRRADGSKKRGYIKPTGDMSKINEMFNDIYIPVEISYNSERHRYEWNFKDFNSDIDVYDEIILNFYEPIINIDQSEWDDEEIPDLVGPSTDNTCSMDINGDGITDCPSDYTCRCYIDENDDGVIDCPTYDTYSPYEGDIPDSCRCFIDENDNDIDDDIEILCPTYDTYSPYEGDIPDSCGCFVDENDDDIIDCPTYDMYSPYEGDGVIDRPCEDE